MRKTTKTLVQGSLGIFGLVLAFTYASACGGDESTNTVGGCTPNATQACLCAAGMGVQTCAADGKSWTPCDCGGGGGASASSASAGGSGQGTSTGGTGQASSSGQGGTGQASSSGQGGTGQASSSSSGGGLCPPNEPQSQDPCTDPVTACNYDTSHCECWPAQMGGGNLWDCDNCPMTEPMDGDGCGNFGNQRCFFGNTTCYCPGGGGTQNWNCSTCPAQQPMNMDPCGMENGAHCVYGQTACSCFGFMGNYTWFCN